MPNIQSSINQAIGAVGKTAAVTKAIKTQAEATEAEKQKQAATAVKEAEAQKAKDQRADLSAINAVPGYQATIMKAEGMEQLAQESKTQSAGIQAKIEAQKQKLADPALTKQQKAGHKGAITRMQEAQSRVEEQRSARAYQADLLRKRQAVLKAIHGASWERQGIDPEGGMKHAVGR